MCQGYCSTAPAVLLSGMAHDFRELTAKLVRLSGWQETHRRHQQKGNSMPKKATTNEAAKTAKLAAAEIYGHIPRSRRRYADDALAKLEDAIDELSRKNGSTPDDKTTKEAATK